ncbi:MAG TPA: PAS domain S-box protein [Verrucomicrobium sp.]|nr:PAS domain S-box protein [Verrucomicrobium sp.]
MNAVVIVWSMAAAISLTLGAVHAVVWLMDRKAWANFSFFMAAVAMAAVAACELALMHTASPARYGEILRWAHLPVFVLIVSVVGFVHWHFKTGRRWLGIAVVGVLVASLVLNFFQEINLNYMVIHSLKPISFFGERVWVVGDSLPNHWTRLGELGSLLMFIFVLDASISLWRKGGYENRRKAATVGASVVLFILVAAGLSAMIHTHKVEMPYLVSLPVLAIVVAMGSELSRDVLRAARMAEELQASEERVSLAAEAAKLGIWVWNAATGVLWITDRGRALFGYAPGTTVNYESLQSRVHPEDRDRRDNGVLEAMERGTKYEMEYRVILPDGSQRWLAAYGRCVRSSDGLGNHLLGVSMDVTERKGAEVALRESESRFRSMADSTPMMMWMAGSDRRCTFFNRGWLDFTGRPMEQETGDGWMEGVHPDDRENCQRGYTSAFESRVPVTLEYRLRRHDGVYRWVLDTGTPRFTANGNFIGYIGSCLDITERRQAEMEIQQQRAELAHVGRVSTLGQLASSIAHELNQPLGAILRNVEAAELFLKGDAPDLAEIRTILADVRKDDQRAGKVIERMRALLQRRSLEFQPLCLAELLEDTVALTRADALARGAILATDLDPELPLIRGDRIQLQQVLLNLVLNALDALDSAAPPRRCIVLRARADGSDAVALSVADTGHGIPPDRVGRVFEPFYTTKATGMGVGLAICRTIVESHGGKICAGNNADGGATFHMMLTVAGKGEFS